MTRKKTPEQKLADAAIAWWDSKRKYYEKTVKEFMAISDGHSGSKRSSALSKAGVAYLKETGKDKVVPIKAKAASKKAPAKKAKIAKKK